MLMRAPLLTVRHALPVAGQFQRHLCALSLLACATAACHKAPAPAAPPVAAAPTPTTPAALPAALTPVALANAASATTPAPLPAAPTEGALGGFRAGLTPEQRAAALAGRTEFFRVYTAADGLGPYFNDASCQNCHSQPTEGGSQDISHAARLWFEAPDRVHTFQRHQLDGYPPLVVPPGAPVALMRPPQLYGLHALAGVPDDVIRAGCDPDDRDHDGVRGHVNIAYNGHVGRLGQKAHTDSIRDFVADAAAGEMGVTNLVQRDPDHVRDADPTPDPDAATPLIDALVAYVDALAPPARSGSHPEGEAVFESLGCVKCHRPLTAPGVPAYTDRCVHDLGPAFSNGVKDLEAKPSEFRTSPLWGLAHRKMFFHDARTDQLEAAVRMHGGEAEAIARKASALPPEKMAQLVAFLRTL